jgi:hypothetical protein
VSNQFRASSTFGERSRAYYYEQRLSNISKLKVTEMVSTFLACSRENPQATICSIPRSISGGTSFWGSLFEGTEEESSDEDGMERVSFGAEY